MDNTVSSEFQDVRKLLWGDKINDDLFRRWSQGIVFSTEEPTALVQLEGGPCAILAPVQAFILKYLLSDPDVLQDNQLRHITVDKVDSYLCEALTEILHQAATVKDQPSQPAPSSKLAQIQASSSVHPSSEQVNVPVTTSPQPITASADSSQSANTNASAGQYRLVFLNEPLSSRISAESDPELMTTPPSIVESNKRLQRPEHEVFHRNLRVFNLETRSQVESVLREKLEAIKGYYGVLQFLYSLILTKGISKLNHEMSDATELIDPVYGHGSQCLINLMLTGRGVGHVWDYEKEVGGMTLQGIVHPTEVGFLTLLERLRYCEVGSFYKNPKFPVWVVGSETHLTVVFSTNMNLVCPETPAEAARRVFRSFDPDGNNFISAILLEDVMRTLGLFADSEYVELMKKRLDPETLGVILMHAFVDEFYPNDMYGRPDTFTVYHYNGLPRPSSSRRVVYHEGNAVLLETDLRCLSDDNQILTCLQTKWPSIDIEWLNCPTPSIN